MPGSFGDIVTNLTIDKRSFEGGLSSVSKDLAKVRRDIASIAPAAAAGNKEAFTSLVSLVSVEEHLADVARKSAATEASARRLVVGQVREQIAEEIRLDQVQSRRSVTFGQSASRGGGGFGGNRSTFALLELSRGAEDAAVSFGTAGLAGAIRGSANNLAAFATIINPMAGVVVGLGAAIASVLIPRLAQMKSEADLAKESMEGLEKRLASVRGDQEGKESLEQLRGSNTSADREQQAKALESQRSKVSDLRKEYAALQVTLRELTRLNAIIGGDDPGKSDDVRRQTVEAEKRLRDTGDKLRLAEFALSNGEAVRRGITGEGSEYLTTGATREQRADYNLRLVREQRARVNAERAEQQRLRGIDESSLQGSILTGFNARLGSLQQQRAGLMQLPRSFNLPELATRGNSLDKQIEMSQSKKEAVAESQRRMQIEKLDKQIDLLQRLIDQVRDVPLLKPARVG